MIRSCNLGGEKYKKLDDAYTELRSAAIRIELVSGSIMALSSMLLRSGIGVTAFVGVHLLTAGRIDFLVMLMFLLIASRIYGPILTVLTLRWWAKRETIRLSAAAAEIFSLAAETVTSCGAGQAMI